MKYFLPMQIRGPSPNGMFAAGLYNLLSLLYRSGINLIGSGKYSGSRNIPINEIMIGVPFSILRLLFGT